MLSRAGKIILLLTALDIHPAKADQDKETVSVVIGRFLSIGELPDPCETEEQDPKFVCITMDSLYQAEYQVIATLSGTPPKSERIKFRIADHYGFPDFANYKNAMLVIRDIEEEPYLEKYMGFAIQPLAGGGWGSCGNNYDDGAEQLMEPLEFKNDFGIVGESSEAALQHMYYAPFFAINGNSIKCVRGLTLQSLYEFIRNGTLAARKIVVPELNMKSLDNL